MSLLNKESALQSSIMSLSCKELQLLELYFFAQQRIFFVEQRVIVFKKLALERASEGEPKAKRI